MKKLIYIYELYRRWLGKLFFFFEKLIKKHYIDTDNQLMVSLFLYWKVINVFLLNLCIVLFAGLELFFVVAYRFRVIYGIGVLLIFIILIFLFGLVLYLRFYKKFCIKYILSSNTNDITFFYKIFIKIYIYMCFITFLNLLLGLSYIYAL